MPWRPSTPVLGAVLDIPQIQIGPKQIVDVCRTAKEDPRLAFKMLLCLTAVDYREYFQVVYLLLSLQHEQKLFIKTDVPYDDPQLPSVTSVWRAADWYEREAHDLFGIRVQRPSQSQTHSSCTKGLRDSLRERNSPSTITRSIKGRGQGGAPGQGHSPG